MHYVALTIRKWDRFNYLPIGPAYIEDIEKFPLVFRVLPSIADFY